MGKDWYWCNSGGGGAAKSSKRGRARARNRDTISFSGCMSVVFQFFDFHHFQYCLHHPSSSIYLPGENDFSTVLKGMEAPRNSLELELESEEAEEGEVSVLSPFKQDDKLHFPMGMQIKTRASNDLSSENSCSPGTKTPTLVARLMGLDLLPADSCSSPSSSIHATPPSSNKSHLLRFIGQRNVSGTCSLPETPRVSSSSSRRSVDTDRRLSLQINKDNISEELEFKSLRRKERRYQDENRSARQIAKEVKETVNRRVGLVDITNSSHLRRRDEELLVKSKKSPKSSENNSCSPRLRFLESNKNKSSITTPTEPLFSKSLENNSCSPRLRFLESNKNMSSITTPTEPLSPLQKQASPNKKVTSGERFRSRLKKPPQTSEIVRKRKQEETFVRPLSSMKATSTVIPDRNKCNKTQSSRKQSQVCDGDGAQESRRSSRLSSCASQKYMQVTHTHKHKPSGDSEDSTSKATCAGSAQHEYVTRILKRTGVYKDTTAMRWFSPCHPLDPSIFHQLELTTDTTCSTAKDRKLLFHVVDEMLVETPGFGHMQGSKLVDTLCAKIRSLPGKNCRALEDIDAIIERDLSRRWFVEEEESIVSEIGTGVLETLLHETASMLLSFQIDDAYLTKNGTR